MEFQCKKLIDPESGKPEIVHRENCEECTCFDDCKKDGYLDEIDKAFNISPEILSKNKRLQALAKLCQRARDPNYLRKDKKDDYRSRITGAIALQETPFTDEQLHQVFGELGVRFEKEQGDKLRHIAHAYLNTKAIWDAKPSYGESKPVLEKIALLAEQLGNCLDGLQVDLRSLLAREILLGNLEEMHIALHSFRPAIERLLEEKIAKYPANKVPLMIFINELLSWFEEITGQKPHITFNPYYETATVSPCLTFICSCVEAVDPEAIA